VVFVVVVVNAFLILSAATALRPSRMGLFAALAFPVGWAAGELPLQAMAAEGGLLEVLHVAGWPPSALLRTAVIVTTAAVVLMNVALGIVQLSARRSVRRQVAMYPMFWPRPFAKPAHVRWWRTLVQWPFAPRGRHRVRNISYGPHPEQTLDVWAPSGKGPHPVVVYLHGGSWVFGDKREQGLPFLHEMYSRGWVIVTANYRLAPDQPWPAQGDDALAVCQWVQDYVAAYGGDHDRVVLAGNSAGGHLATWAALEERKSPRRNWGVRGCISFYGVLEMTGEETHWQGLGHGLRVLLEHRVVQKPYEGNEALYESLSPLHQVHRDAPPVLAIQGTADTLVDVGVARAYVAAHNAVAFSSAALLELPLTQHSFDLTRSPRTSAVVCAAAEFAATVSVPREPLSPELLEAYQSPPTVIKVEGQSPLEVAAARGDYFIVTAHNPYSVPQEPAMNTVREAALSERVARHHLTSASTVASDGVGHFPPEEGIALWCDEETAAALARAFDQYAYYAVGNSVVVKDSRTELILRPV
jgi:acetyl esterase/lipase